jgi:hypothetical protein
MSIHFVTFGSDDFEPQVTRITNEARHTGWFSSVRGMFTRDLDPSFLNKHEGFLKGRGYGFWIWKPQVILQSLNEISDGDVLVYADSGCTWNRKGEQRFQEYVQMVNQHPSGVLGFQLAPHIENLWTKREVFEALGYDGFNTPQICATYILIRKCEYSLNIIREWSTLTQHYKLINDDKWLPQYRQFKDHRHDQSIWSLLVKKLNVCIVPTDEGYPSGRLEYPLWGSRLHKSAVSPYKLD